jgi:hypothetical protein
MTLENYNNIKKLLKNTRETTKQDLPMSKQKKKLSLAPMLVRELSTVYVQA